MINSKELLEAEAIQREDALKRIAALVRRYELTQAEVLQIWAGDPSAALARKSLPEAKRFDPFFDAW